jgi:hypothetical protein
MRVPYTVIVREALGHHVAKQANLSVDGEAAVREAREHFKPYVVVGVLKGSMASTWVSAPVASEDQKTWEMT